MNSTIEMGEKKLLQTVKDSIHLCKNHNSTSYSGYINMLTIELSKLNRKSITIHLSTHRDNNKNYHLSSIHIYTKKYSYYLNSSQFKSKHVWKSIERLVLNRINKIEEENSLKIAKEKDKSLIECYNSLNDI